ncbi:MAG: hypothetical protein WC876_01925 [Candidatus Thermoplasmatota archaeon]
MTALPRLPLNAALPASPAFRCTEACRSPEHLQAVVAQFSVETSARYSARDGNTYCNIFAWDVTSAMGAEVPHWVNGAGVPSAPGHGVELSANALMDWLRSDAALERGWRMALEADAECAANLGNPALVLYRNPHGHGHCAVLLGDGRIAQAGQRCFSRGDLAVGFGGLPVSYFVHP